MDISKVYDIGALMQNGAYFPQQPISYAPPDVQNVANEVDSLFQTFRQETNGIPDGEYLKFCRNSFFHFRVTMKSFSIKMT